MSPLEMTHILRLSRYVHCNLSFDGVRILTSFVHCQQSCKLESELIPTFPLAKYTFVRTRWFSNWYWLQWWLLLLSCLILLDHGNLISSTWCAFETQKSHKILSWVPGTQGFSFPHRLSPVAHTVMTRPVDLAELQGPGVPGPRWP